MNIIAIILMFGVIVFVHEFGHFLFAKLSHVAVTEFSIGMGPAIAKWNKKETTYALRALPIGGYVIMEGEAEKSDNPNAITNKSILSRFTVMFAGPFFNFILAFGLSIILLSFVPLDPAEISEVQKNSAAETAGLESGDVITEINGGRIYNFREISLYRLSHDPSVPVKIKYVRDKKSFYTTLTQKKDTATGKYYFGITCNERKARNFAEQLRYSYYEVRFQVKSTIYSLKILFSGKGSKDDLMGPVGIGNMMNDVINESKKSGGGFGIVLLNIINFTILISANIGVMNLLPVPALDGGRILFLALEAVMGKPVPKKYETTVTAVFMIMLLLLVIFVFFNDIGNLFQK